jgi:hypothetical protein
LATSGVQFSIEPLEQAVGFDNPAEAVSKR